MVSAARLGLLGLTVTAFLSATVIQGRPAVAATTSSKKKAHASAAKTARSKRPTKARKGKATPVAAASATAAAADKKSGDESGLWFLAKPGNVVPNQRGKVVLFSFANDDDGAVSTQVGQLLEARGLEVLTGVRRVDSAEQYRDVATQLELVGYIDGDVRGSDEKTRVTVRLRSGYSGRNVAQAQFTESRSNLPREMSDKLWTKLGRPVARACTDADKPRRRSRTTLQIDAGKPLD
jgi:hypothetical protein